ncbi:AraC family transcriptional regulator [Paenibacillus ginsengarvi]|uniref:AraC family transcriptional regulator n=1 Tax=Paenibacillus ginsengarvi TaxID=400777 RepID=A0A3B0CGC1_9BACL|nr:AraC family transcriptional regulator [Paenibacillus ginsengarvi]RKN83804.1 AraC family transcriptional regulator [Paenibacillus ginsengarvi]
MKTNKSLSRLRHLLANVQVHLTFANYSKVDARWRQLNFVPDFNRFYYIREGEGCLVIDGETYYPRPGQLFVMPAGVKMSYYSLDENYFGKYWCHFTARIGDTELFRLTGAPYFIDVEDGERLTRLFKELIAHYESGEFSSVLMQKAVLFEMISLYLEGAARNRLSFPPSREDKGMHNLNLVLKYIETHLHENVTVQQLADLVHFHPNYLIRQFRELVGVSPIQYVQRLKMETAKSLLTATNEPVSEVARAVGLELYYFSRMFKKHMGVAPTEYRQLMKS